MYIFYDKSTFTIKENLTINIKIFNTNIFMANEIKSTIISEEYVPVSEDFPLINCWKALSHVFWMKSKS